MNADNNSKDTQYLVNSAKEELKSFAIEADKRIEERVNDKIEAFLVKLDNIKADLADDVKELREDFKDQTATDTSGRRWVIAIVLTLAVSALTAMGGYFITAEVTSTRLDYLSRSFEEHKLAFKEHLISYDHGRIKVSQEYIENLEEDLLQLREDFRTYIKK